MSNITCWLQDSVLYFVMQGLGHRLALADYAAMPPDANIGVRDGHVVDLKTEAKSWLGGGISWITRNSDEKKAAREGVRNFVRLMGEDEHYGLIGEAYARSELKDHLAKGRPIEKPKHDAIKAKASELANFIKMIGERHGPIAQSYAESQLEDLIDQGRPIEASDYDEIEKQATHFERYAELGSAYFSRETMGFIAGIEDKFGPEAADFARGRLTKELKYGLPLLEGKADSIREATRQQWRYELGSNYMKEFGGRHVLGRASSYRFDDRAFHSYLNAAVNAAKSSTPSGRSGVVDKEKEAEEGEEGEKEQTVKTTKMSSGDLSMEEGVVKEATRSFLSVAGEVQVVSDVDTVRVRNESQMVVSKATVRIYQEDTERGEDFETPSRMRYVVGRNDKSEMTRQIQEGIESAELVSKRPLEKDDNRLQEFRADEDRLGEVFIGDRLVKEGEKVEDVLTEELEKWFEGSPVDREQIRCDLMRYIGQSSRGILFFNGKAGPITSGDLQARRAWEGNLFQSSLRIELEGRDILTTFMGSSRGGKVQTLHGTFLGVSAQYESRENAVGVVRYTPSPEGGHGAVEVLHDSMDVEIRRIEE